MADPARNEHLFVVRIWTEPAAQGSGSQRGCIEHVASKERRYFSQLAEALDFLAALAKARRVSEGTGSRLAENSE